MLVQRGARVMLCAFATVFHRVLSALDVSLCPPATAMRSHASAGRNGRHRAVHSPGGCLAVGSQCPRPREREKRPRQRRLGRLLLRVALGRAAGGAHRVVDAKAIARIVGRLKMARPREPPFPPGILPGTVEAIAMQALDLLRAVLHCADWRARPRVLTWLFPRTTSWRGPERWCGAGRRPP